MARGVNTRDTSLRCHWWSGSWSRSGRRSRWRTSRCSVRTWRRTSPRRGGPGGRTVDMPWIVSVDDHVIEPPHAVGVRLPARYRDAGPARRAPARRRARACRARATSSARHRRPARRLLGVRGPVPVAEARRRGRGSPARRDDDDRDDLRRRAARLLRPGRARSSTWTRTGRRRRCASRTSHGSAARRSSRRRTASSRCSACSAYNDWMVEEWCAPSGGRLVPLCLVPLWDADARRGRGRAQRGARRARGRFSRDPRVPRAAEHSQRRLGSVLRGVRGDRHRRCACTSGRARRCRRRRPTRRSA